MASQRVEEEGLAIIFGPVHSRRFGRSLGIDLSPSKKQCNFDCLYCELEPAKTIQAYDEVVSPDEVMEALAKALGEHRDIDCITLTANGEPTLYPHLSSLIDRIDAIKGDVTTLILSNGSTIMDPQTREALAKLDMVKLSLDCASDACLHKLDRAHRGITVQAIKDGMLAFKALYRGELIIEILFVKTLNDSPEEIAALNSFLLRLQPARIDIGTIDRPPAYRVQPLSYDELYCISQLFDPSLPIYIASRKNVAPHPESYSSQEILQTLSKRPLSPDDIEVLMDDESKERLKKLLEEKKIVLKEINNIIFYTIS